MARTNPDRSKGRALPGPARPGEVLRLGDDPDTVTLLHLAEPRADVAGKRSVRRHRRIVTADGPRVVVIETLDDPDGIVDHPGEDYFATVLRSYLATGRAATGRVGAAPSELIDAADLLDHAVAWMGAHLGAGPDALRSPAERWQSGRLQSP